MTLKGIKLRIYPNQEQQLKIKLNFGYDDGYYWDYTIVGLNPDEKTLTVTFSIGSGSGYIPMDYTEYNVGIEDFRQYLINRKWKDQDIDTIEILASCINEIDGV